MTTTRKKPVHRTPEQWDAWHKRQDIWRHNAFTGHALMARANMSAIIQSNTATDAAKALALQIHVLTNQLADALKERR